jgi:hypothetical protein
VKTRRSTIPRPGGRRQARRGHARRQHVQQHTYLGLLAVTPNVAPSTLGPIVVLAFEKQMDNGEVDARSPTSRVDVRAPPYGGLSSLTRSIAKSQVGSGTPYIWTLSLMVSHPRRVCVLLTSG